MQVTITIPDEFAARVVPQGQDAERLLLEELVAGAYRDGRLTMEQVRQVLGLDTRSQVDVFLQRHAVYDYTIEDLNKDIATLDRLIAKRA